VPGDVTSSENKRNRSGRGDAFGVEHVTRKRSGKIGKLCPSVGSEVTENRKKKKPKRSRLLEIFLKGGGEDRSRARS